jgi:chorismate dehydratase
VKGWSAVQTGDGSWTLRHPCHGEACHSLAGAWQESVERYARPCRLAVLGLERRGGSVRLLDVGTGVALNLAAARAALAGTGAALDALTLELDPAAIECACDLPATPPEADVGLAELRAALQQCARAGGGVCELKEQPGACRARIALALGDARGPGALARAGSAPWDAVFLDPFSPRVDRDLWELDFLRRVAAGMAPHAVLSTYSSAVQVRRALAASGLRLGRGPRVGTKASGTLASRAAELPPLEPREARKALPR